MDMGLIKKYEFTDRVVSAVWQIEEEADFFLKNMDLSVQEVAELELLRGNRKLEWLAVRYLSREIMGYGGYMFKDTFGKPYWYGTERMISLSHTSGRVAFAVGSAEVIGIDIQVMSDKIMRVAHKFANPDEADRTNKEQLHVVWSAKESMYKAYGRGGVDFLNHLRVLPSDWGGDSGMMRGYFEKGKERIDFDIHYFLEGDYVLVLALSDFIRLPTALYD
jgi:4'-phosphopantetheinyl transferase